jgi:PAS domain S-box-containing protein
MTDYSLLESAPDAIVIIDAAGHIVFANSQAAALFGYTNSELVGQPLEMLIPERYRGIHAGHRRAYVDAPRTRAMGAGLELYARRKSGDEFPVEISLSPLTADDLRVISAIRDITGRKRAEAERERLIEERAAYAEASRVKDEFLATLSHELRTPLNSILGWISMLKSGRLDQARAEHALEAIDRNAKLQAQLVEDLLDVSRVITGKLHVELGPADLVDIARAAVDVVQPSAEAKHLSLEVVPEETPILILADAERLQQAIWNLLTNAVKFTPAGGRIELRIRAEAMTASVIVRDTGQGIDPEFLPRVFDRFRQANSTTTRAHGGLGLGLAIVKSVVEAHGGQVAASSAGPNRGSTFTLTLPAARTTERRRHARVDHVALEQLRDAQLLVVDDAPDDRDLFATILGQYGAVVETSGNVASAQDLLERAFRPAAILCDIAMPGQDGYDFVRWLRTHQDRDLAETPSIAVTAHARAEDKRRALEAGFQKYVSKPVDAESLIAAVASVLRPHGLKSLRNGRDETRQP